MSTIPSTSASHSNFVSVFNAALESYKRKTKNDLASHPLLPSLQSCDSPEAILTVLREQIPTFSQPQNGDDRLTKWVAPTINVLYSFSATLGGGVGIVNIRMFPCEKITVFILAFQAFPPANTIFAGIGVLLLVSVFHGSRLLPILTRMTPRRLKMLVLAKTSLSNSLTTLSVSSSGFRFTLGLHRPRL